MMSSWRKGGAMLGGAGDDALEFRYAEEHRQDR